jgi:hypothetical protein
VTANAAQSRAGGGCQAQQLRLVLRVVDSAMLGAVAIALAIGRRATASAT